MDIKGMLPKLIGFIAIVITLALAPSIYTANLTVVNFASGSGVGLGIFTGMAAISPYGGFLLILGILVAQGIFAIGQFRESGGGWRNMFAMVGVVVAAIILLNLFSAAVMPAFRTLVMSASTNADTIGETVFGVLVIIIYLGIIVGTIGFESWRGARRGKSSRRAAVAAGY